MLIFDIETVPNEKMVDFLPEVKPPGNYKKPESIQQWLDENGEEARQEMVDKMALDMCLAKVRAIGVWSSESYDKIPIVHLVGKPTKAINAYGYSSEAALLKQFWGFVHSFGFPLVGFNSNAFDLPILFWRSMMLGVPTGLGKPFNRYDSDFVDLYDALTLKNPRLGSMAGLGLKSVTRMLGIPNDLPDVDGSQVKNMTDEELVRYLTSDIDITRALYYRMEGVYFPGQPEGEAF